MKAETTTRLPHIVVLGAGFGGLTFCQRFSAKAARITLIDRQNHHLFQPLLYQVATAGLAAPDIAQPIRSILSGKPNLKVMMERVVDIELAAKKVVLETFDLEYDYLVLGLGGATSYFGNDKWAPFARGLKSLEDALAIRRDVLYAFEQAEVEPDPERRKKLMTIAVVGGGPTGVELAGAFAELTRVALSGDFENINSRQARVVLVEAGPRVLGHLPDDLSASALRQLRSLGVEVKTGIKVTAVREGELDLTDGLLSAATIVWAAGVSANPLTLRLNVPIDRAGRVKVQPDLSLPGHPEVFGVGDMVTLVDKNGVTVPGVSPAAMQMARHAAVIIEAECRGGGKSSAARPAFAYFDKGTMATIGRSKAVAMIGRFRFSGFAAWAAWLGVHLVFLVGFRNRLSVLLSWTYSYFTYKRGSRLIIGLPKDL